MGGGVVRIPDPPGAYSRQGRLRGRGMGKRKAVAGDLSDGGVARRLGHGLRTRRQALNMTLEAAGAAAGGVTRQNLFQYETGRRRCPLGVACRLAAALGCGLDALLEHDPDPPGGRAGH